MGGEKWRTKEQGNGAKNKREKENEKRGERDGGKEVGKEWEGTRRQYEGE